MEKVIVESTVTRKNYIVMATAIFAFAVLFIFSLYKWVKLTMFQPLELMAEALILFVLVERMNAKYTYQMEKAALKLTKHGLLGTIGHEVLYRDIFGVYRYKPQLVGVIKFRRTYRLNSALDGRDVWTLAYTVPGKSKRENRRIYFKPGSELLSALSAKLPDKVMVSEEQVINDAITRDSQKK